MRLVIGSGKSMRLGLLGTCPGRVAVIWPTELSRAILTGRADASPYNLETPPSSYDHHQKSSDRG